MQFSPQQDKALLAVNEWLKDPDSQLFRLFGYAGTGKTTLAKHLAQGVTGGVLFAAFTGKAAHVLQTKGCEGASTIHSLIYRPVDKSRKILEELEAKLAELKARDPDEQDLDEEARLLQALKAERENLRRPFFHLNLESPVREAALVVVDECSMVDTAMAHDLLSFGTKVLVLGDPAQLPPVAGGGYFTEHAPDFMLTEIHRQAADNPIIAMATKIRGARMPTYGQYGDSCVVSSFDMQMALAADQILVGKNVTRKKLNARIRTQLGRSSAEPEPGDRIVCLQNNHQEGLLNGALWEVQGVTKHKVSPDIASLHIKSEDTGANVEVDAFLHYFRGQEPAFHQRGYADHFDYGYALTCHKSQGSQWGSVLVLDESDAFRENKWRWLYTAVTRAADKVSVVVT